MGSRPRKSVTPVAPVEEDMEKESMEETHEEEHMEKKHMEKESMEETHEELTEEDLGSVLRLSRANVPATIPMHHGIL